MTVDRPIKCNFSLPFLSGFRKAGISMHNGTLASNMSNAQCCCLRCSLKGAVGWRKMPGLPLVFLLCLWGRFHQSSCRRVRLICCHYLTSCACPTHSEQYTCFAEWKCGNIVMSFAASCWATCLYKESLSHRLNLTPITFLSLLHITTLSYFFLSFVRNVLQEPILCPCTWCSPANELVLLILPAFDEYIVMHVLVRLSCVPGPVFNQGTRC